MLASPIYAGFAKNTDEAQVWWRSPAGDSAIVRLKRSGVYFTPTLALYAANVDLPPDTTTRRLRRELIPFLLELTGRMYRAGIPIMAGSDIAAPRSDHRPGQALLEEMKWLSRAGLSEADVRRAALDNVKNWLNDSPPR